MKLYLAGPMRTERHLNFPLFLWAAAVLRLKGFEVVSPAELDLEAGDVAWDYAACTLRAPCVVDGSIERATVLQRDASRVLSCDGMVLLPGWHRSDGVMKTELPAVKWFGRSTYRFFEITDTTNMTMQEIFPLEELR